MRKHDKFFCSNRKVRCRNFELGCPCLVRLSTRHLHEQIEHLTGPRSCIKLGGGQSFIALNDEDLEPPYTVEYWLFKARRDEATVQLLGRLLDLRIKYYEAKDNTHEFKNRVETLERQLAEVSQRVAQ